MAPGSSLVGGTYRRQPKVIDVSPSHWSLSLSLPHPSSCLSTKLINIYSGEDYETKIHLGLSCVSAPGPEKQQNQVGDSWINCIDSLPCRWPISGDHKPQRTHLESWWIFYWDLPLGPPLELPPLKALRTGDPAHSFSVPLHFPLKLATSTLLSPKLQGCLLLPLQLVSRASYSFYHSLLPPLWLPR